jgi:acetyltransferase-like isoleucine patch superfamily enzyme
MASVTLDVIQRRLTRDNHLPISEQIGKGVDFARGLATAPVYLRECQRVGRSVRTVDAPFVRNAGRIEIGDRVVINSELGRVRLEAAAGATLMIGAGTLVHYGATLRAGGDVVIGERVYVGPRSLTNADDTRPIIIGDGVWIGQAVTIRPGSRIGARAVIAAGSVVDGEIPAGVLAVGAPAQSVRSIDARVDDEDTRTLPDMGGFARLAADLLVPTARAGARAIAAARSAMTSRNEWSELRERVRTAFVLRDADRVGHRVRVSGRVVVHNLGRVEIGDDVALSGDPELTHLATGVAGTLVVGPGARVGSGCGICAHDRVEIGAETVIGELCSILDTSFHGVSDRTRVARPRPVVIGRRVRLGERSLVMPGAKIGDGATLDPGSVVTREVAPGAHVGGVSARPL